MFKKLILLFSCLLLVACNARTSDYVITITYSDGPSGILCIDSRSMQKNEINAYIETVTLTSGKKTPIEITNDVDIEIVNGQWVVSYTIKKGWWIFSSEKTLHEPITFNELYALSIIYPDENGKCLRIDNEYVQISDLNRLRIEATFDDGSKKDVTDSCKLALTTTTKDRIQLTYELRKQTITKQCNISIDKLSELKVEKTGLIPDYPVLSEVDIRNRIKLYAVYFDGTKVDISNNDYQIATSNESVVVQLGYGSKSTTIKKDLLTSIEVEKSGLITDYPVLSEDDIRANVKAYAQYSDGTRIDVTDEINEYSINDSGNIKVQYGNKEATIEYDRLTGLEVLKTGLISDYPSLTEYDIRQRIKLYAVYSNSKKIDITSKIGSYLTNISLTDSGIQIDFGNASASIEYDKLICLEAEKTGLLTDYPVLSEENIKSQVKLYAVYSNKQKVDITDKITIGTSSSEGLAVASLTDDNVNFSYGEKSTSVDLDKLISITAESTGGSKILISNFSKLDTEKLRSKLKITATYSNNEQVDITDRVSIQTEAPSAISLKYGARAIDTEGIFVKASILATVLTCVLIVLSVVSLAASVVILCRMKNDKIEFFVRRQKLFPDRLNDTI